MRFLRDLHSGFVVKITAANPLAFLSALQNANISLTQARYLDDLTLQIRFERRFWPQVSAIAKKRDIKIEVLSETGLYPRMGRVLKRPVLVVGLIVLIAVSLYLPSRILFIRVSGNQAVPTNRILSALSDAGLDFGAARKEIRSEKVKNALLHALPELEWAGVNTAGCVATVSVRERQTTGDIVPEHGVTSIIATRDGVIQEMTVTAGNAVCKVGQGVKAGQVLISGYTDCGISIKAGRARGEIYAATQRQFEVISPRATAILGQLMEKTEKYSLIIGKKRINFFQDSGILDKKCVKMIDTNYLTLPGGFVLPVALVKETYLSYEISTETISTEDVSEILSRRAQAYLSRQMVAGKVLSKIESVSCNEETYLLTGRYACIEMIGKEKNEEIIKP